MQNFFLRRGRIAAAAAGLALALGAQASTLTVLYVFTDADGGQPSSPLLMDKSGALYGTTLGTTQFGESGPGAFGTLYKFADGKRTTLYDFTSEAPLGALAMDAGGGLWGAMASAGTTSTSGSIYRFDAQHGFTTVHAFTGGADGALPLGGLSLAADGTLYGSTAFGGDASCTAMKQPAAPGCGTLFTVDTATLAFATLHTFERAQGVVPEAPVLVIDGVVHGTTSGGVGTSSTLGKPLGKSMPFTIATNGKKFKDVAVTQGVGFASGLVRDAAGNLWGTAEGDEYKVAGGLYKIDPAGQFTWVASFASARAVPTGPLVFDSQGRLLGTNMEDGTAEFGSIYRFDPIAGTLTTLYSFNTQDRALYPLGGLVAGPAGAFYGLAQVDNLGDGAIFSFQP